MDFFSFTNKSPFECKNTSMPACRWLSPPSKYMGMWRLKSPSNTLFNLTNESSWTLGITVLLSGEATSGLWTPTPPQTHTHIPQTHTHTLTLTKRRAFYGMASSTLSFKASKIVKWNTVYYYNHNIKSWHIPHPIDVVGNKLVANKFMFSSSYSSYLSILWPSKLMVYCVL